MSSPTTPPSTKRSVPDLVAEIREELRPPPGKTFSEGLAEDITKKAKELPLSIFLGVPAFFTTFLPLLFRAAADGYPPGVLTRIFQVFVFAFLVLPLGFVVFRGLGAGWRFGVGAAIGLLAAAVFNPLLAAAVTLLVLAVAAFSAWRVSSETTVNTASPVSRGERTGGGGGVIGPAAAAPAPPPPLKSAAEKELREHRRAVLLPLVSFATVGLVALIATVVLARAMPDRKTVGAIFEWPRSLAATDSLVERLSLIRDSAEHPLPLARKVGAPPVATNDSVLRRQADEAWGTLDTLVHRYAGFVTDTLLDDSTHAQRKLEDASRTHGDSTHADSRAGDSRRRDLVGVAGLVRKDSARLTELQGALQELIDRQANAEVPAADSVSLAAEQVDAARRAVLAALPRKGTESNSDRGELDAARRRLELLSEELQLMQIRHRARLWTLHHELAALLKKKDDHVRRNISSTFNVVRKVCRWTFGTGLLILVFGTLIPQLAPAPSNPDAARIRSTYLLGIALLALLLVPLLPELEPEDVNPRAPLDAFVLPSWYLPEFIRASGTPLRSRGGEAVTTRTMVIEREVPVDTTRPSPQDSTVATQLAELRSEVAQYNLQLDSLRLQMPDAQATKTIRETTQLISQRLDSFAVVLRTERRPTPPRPGSSPSPQVH